MISAFMFFFLSMVVIISANLPLNSEDWDTTGFFFPYGDDFLINNFYGDESNTPSFNEDIQEADQMVINEVVRKPHVMYLSHADVEPTQAQGMHVFDESFGEEGNVICKDGICSYTLMTSSPSESEYETMMGDNFHSTDKDEEPLFNDSSFVDRGDDKALPISSNLQSFFKASFPSIVNDKENSRSMFRSVSHRKAGGEERLDEVEIMCKAGVCSKSTMTASSGSKSPLVIRL